MNAPPTAVMDRGKNEWMKKKNTIVIMVHAHLHYAEVVKTSFYKM